MKPFYLLLPILLLTSCNKSFDNNREAILHDFKRFEGKVASIKIVGRDSSLRGKILEVGKAGVFLSYADTGDPGDTPNLWINYEEIKYCFVE